MMHALLFLLTLVSAVHAGSAPVYTSCVSPGKIALTFDDGPGQNLPLVLNLLRAKNIVATFFINSENWYASLNNQNNVNNLRAAFNSGRVQIGNHGYWHSHMTDRDLKDQTDNIVNLGNRIHSILGVRPAFYRPAFGQYNTNTTIAAALSGMKAVVTWNDASLDCLNSDTEKCYQTFKNNLNYYNPATRSFIILMHEFRETIITSLAPRVIDLLKAKGFQFVTVAECLGYSKLYQ